MASYAHRCCAVVPLVRRYVHGARVSHSYGCVHAPWPIARRRQRNLGCPKRSACSKRGTLSAYLWFLWIGGVALIWPTSLGFSPCRMTVSWQGSTWGLCAVFPSRRQLHPSCAVKPRTDLAGPVYCSVVASSRMVELDNSLSYTSVEWSVCAPFRLRSHPTAR